MPECLQCLARATRPADLVVAHGGRGAPTLFLKDLLDCPIINYCEYYFATSHRDISYRIDLPPAEPAPFFPRCINAPMLASLVDCDAGYSATHWQKQSFPARFHSKIEVYFDGIDTELYRPGAALRRIGAVSLPQGTKVVTFVTRGLESIRGFDLFMQVADRICHQRADVLFVVVGGEEIHY
ncbi:MAG: glycosyltransferase, partial [Isosphaeraceae bacterium]